MRNDDYVWRMSDAVSALLDGFSEPIEYAIMVNGETVRKAWARPMAGLIPQLHAQAAAAMESTGQSGGGNPNKSASRPPTNSRYSDAVDTFHEQALELWATLETQEPASRLATLLKELRYSVKRQIGDKPLTCAAAVLQAEAWVKRARILLGYDVRQVMLANVVCHVCGGGLAVAADASSDVQCIGTPDEPACGKTYARTSWIDLLVEDYA